MDISWQRKLFSFLIFFPWWIKIFSKKSIPAFPERILILQWDYLGDIIVSTPAIQLVRNKYPYAYIRLITSPANKGYIDGFRSVNEIVYIKNPLHIGRECFGFTRLINCILNIRKEKYDIVIELTGRLPNQVFLIFIKGIYKIGLDSALNVYLLDKRVEDIDGHRADIYMDIVRKACASNNVDVKSLSLWNPATDEDRSFIDNILKEKHVMDRCIIIHPTASWGPRQWPLDRWAGVSNYLSAMKKPIIFIGAQKDSFFIEKIRSLLQNGNLAFNFSGLINIRQTIALMERAEMFIGSDSGPMHLAAVANLMGIVIFGPGDPIKWGYPSLHKIIYKKQPCSPCAQFAFMKVCAKKLAACSGLTAIAASEVIEKLEELLYG